MADTPRLKLWSAEANEWEKQGYTGTALLKKRQQYLQDYAGSIPDTPLGQKAKQVIAADLSDWNLRFTARRDNKKGLEGAVEAFQEGTGQSTAGALGRYASEAAAEGTYSSEEYKPEGAGQTAAYWLGEIAPDVVLPGALYGKAVKQVAKQAIKQATKTAVEQGLSKQAVKQAANQAARTAAGKTTLKQHAGAMAKAGALGGAAGESARSLADTGVGDPVRIAAGAALGGTIGAALPYAGTAVKGAAQGAVRSLRKTPVPSTPSGPVGVDAAEAAAAKWRSELEGVDDVDLNFLIDSSDVEAGIKSAAMEVRATRRGQTTAGTPPEGGTVAPGAPTTLRVPQPAAVDPRIDAALELLPVDQLVQLARFHRDPAVRQGAIQRLAGQGIHSLNERLADAPELPVAQAASPANVSSVPPVEPAPTRLDPGTRYANDQIVDMLAKTEMWYGKDYKLKGNKLGGAVKLIAKGQTDEEIGQALKIDPVHISHVRAHYTDRGFTVPESRNDPRFGIWSEHVRKALDTTKGDYQKAFESLAQIPREKTTGAAGSQTGESRLASWMRSPHEPEILPQPQVPPVTAEWPAPSVLQSPIKLTNNAVQAIRQYADSMGISPMGALETLARHTDDAALWEQFRLTPNDAMSIRQAWEALKSQMISPAPTQIPFNAQDAVARLKQMTLDEARVAFAKLSPEQQAQILALEPPPVRPGVPPLSPEQEQLARQALAMERARQIPPEPGPALGEPERPFDYAPEGSPTVNTVPGLAARAESEAQKGALNAPQEGIQPSGSVSERPGVGEIGPTGETGGGNRPAPSGRTTKETPEDEDLTYLGSGLGGFQGKFEKMFGGERPSASKLSPELVQALKTVRAAGQMAEPSSTNLSPELVQALKTARAAASRTTEPPAGAASGGQITGDVSATQSPELAQALKTARAAQDAPSAPRPTKVKTTPEGEETPVFDVAQRNVENLMHRTAGVDEDIQSVFLETMRANEADLLKARGGGPKSFDKTWREAEQYGLEDLLDKNKVPWEELDSRMAALRGELKATTTNLEKTIRQYELGEIGPEQVWRASALHNQLLQTVVGAEAGLGRGLGVLRATEPTRGQAKRLAEVYQALEEMSGKEGSAFKFADMLVTTLKTGGAKGAAKFANKAMKATKWDMVLEYWVNSILSGIPTHIVNASVNAALPFQYMTELAGAAGIGAVKRGLGNQGPRVHGEEVIEAFRGMYQGAGDGLQAARLAFLTGKSSGQYSKLERERGEAIPGLVGKIVRAPGRALVASDEFFKAISHRMALRHLSAREGIEKGLKGVDLQDYITQSLNKPSEELLAQAREIAAVNTFTNSIHDGTDVTRRLGRWAMSGRANIPALTLFVPFVRTLVNVSKHAQERTLFAALDPKMLANLAGKNGKTAQDIAWSKQVFGLGVSGLAIAGLESGNITAGGPSDPDKRKAWIRAGNRQYSIKIPAWLSPDGKAHWQEYNRFAPFGIIMGVAADAATIAKELHEKAKNKGLSALDQKDAVELTASLFQAVINNYTSQNMISGLVALADVMSPGGSINLPKLAGNILGPVIPNIVAKGVQSVDPTIRDARNVADRVLARIAPSVLRARLQPLGEEMKREAGLLTFVWPGSLRSAEKDPVYQELYRLGINMDMPKETVSIRGDDVQISPDRYDDMVKSAGKRIRARVQKEIDAGRIGEKSPLSTDKQEDRVREIIRNEREYARDRVVYELATQTRG